MKKYRNIRNIDTFLRQEFTESGVLIDAFYRRMMYIEYQIVMYCPSQRVVELMLRGKNKRIRLKNLRRGWNMVARSRITSK